MNTLQRLTNKVKRHLKQNGWKHTAQMSVSYIRRAVKSLWDDSNYLDRPGGLTDKGAGTDRGASAEALRTPTIYMLAGLPYYDIGGGQRYAQLSRCFCEMGYRVRYFYAIRTNETRDKGILIPTDSHCFANEKAVQFVREQAKAGDIFILEAPIGQFAPFLEIAAQRGCRLVYESIDNWETSLGEEFFKEELLRQVLTQADVLVGTARPLVDQLKDYLDRFGIDAADKKLLYLANAVNREMFDGKQDYERPADLRQGTKSLVYYGSLWGEWFCWDLVKGLAERHPDYAIYLIGNTAPIPKIVSSCPANIYFLGLKPQRELPAYLRYTDYALLPFDRGEIGDYVSPLKIFEYIAMHSRVLSTPLPDIAGYPNVYFGETVQEWESVLAQDPAVDVAAAEAFTAQNTWEARAKALLKALEM